MNNNFKVCEVSKKPLKFKSETSDYTDFKKITQIVRRCFNLCNLYFNQCNHNERLFQSSLCIFFLILCLLPLELPAADQAPFGGSKITVSMDFQDANLKDVVKIFSIQSGLNSIASEAVQDRKITLFLDKVPIKEAMDKLFKANNLTYELDEEAKVFIVKDWGRPQLETITKVFYLKYATVSSSSIMQEMSKQVSSTGTASSARSSSTSGTSSGSSGTTGSSSSAGGSGKYVSEQEVGITKAVRKNLSKQGFVIEDYRTNSLIVTDMPSRMPDIERLIVSLDVPVPQVMLEVEILDVSKDIVDKLGFKFGTDSATSPLSILAPDVFKRGARAFIGNIAYRGADAFSTAGVVSFGNLYAQVLDFLRTQTDTKYLARPRLLTLNNETAEIYITKDEVVGREDTTTTTAGVTTTTSTFKRSTDLALTKEGTGIFLRVTPQINSERNEVTMVINPKSSVSTISPLSTTANQQADVEVRTTKSIVKVKDGETVVLGGIIHNEKLVTIKKLPL
ncbi:MAG: secretin N-terminal domain-containing protein, partial [Candidatus Omnitrophota bacterium]|nr:secretin N-terminal domain-containing protein [Candidatus Omnitrophota bacterium]